MDASTREYFTAAIPLYTVFRNALFSRRRTPVFVVMCIYTPVCRPFSNSTVDKLSAPSRTFHVGPDCTFL